MSKNYDEAKKLAEKILELEKVRKTAQDDLKLLKDELINICQENSIDRLFEFGCGFVAIEEKTSYKIPDGLKEIIVAQSIEPNQVSQDFIEEFFQPNISLNKLAKKELKNGNNDLLQVVVPETKLKVKIVVAE